MEILNNIIWYFFYDEPKCAKYIYTENKLTKKQLNTIVFDDSVKENVKFCFPLNDNFTFTETRELSRPINVEQVLQLVQDFYKEPLSEEIINKTFGENIEWKDDWPHLTWDNHKNKLLPFNYI